MVGVSQVHEPRAAETDVVDRPDAELGDKGEGGDVLELPHRERGEEPVLGPPVENHRPAPGLDAERWDLAHQDTRRIDFLRRFHAFTGAVGWLPIVTARPSPPPRSWFSKASQTCEYWFLSGSSE